MRTSSRMLVALAAALAILASVEARAQSASVDAVAITIGHGLPVGLPIVLAQLGDAGLPDATSQSFTEPVVTLLTSPMVSSLLIMLGLGGLLYGVKTGHFGGIAMIGLGALALFFGAQYLADLASFLEIFMFLAGVVLLAVEIFVIPGFGVVGILGIVMMITSLFLALGGSFTDTTYDSLAVPLYTLAGSFVGLAIIVSLMVRYLPGSSAFSHLVLQTPASSGMHEIASTRDLVGVEGRALTTLRPAGVALLRDERRDVITDGEYISAGEAVKVVRVEGRKIVVGRSESRELDQGRASTEERA